MGHDPRTLLTPEQAKVIGYFCGELIDDNGNYMGDAADLAAVLKAISDDQRSEGHDAEADRIARLILV
ncbi:MAG TPA: hypothetical protein VHF69_11675 [Candidatus Synoicihabitans sp.]|nr:hypothetical protein [Candidatus Synoicihabitans sp.]